MKKEETRNHILDTAIELFWRASYHGVNMNQLSREVGLNKATVYQYFSSKEELAVAAVQRATERTRQYVFETAFENSQDPVERLRQIYQNVFQTHNELYKTEKACLGCPFVNIGVELATSSEKVRQAVNDGFDVFRAFYQQIVDDYRGKGAASKREKEEIVVALLDNMNACLEASKLQRRPQAILDAGVRAEKILHVW